MSRVVGIDLGTTNTVVAAVRDAHAWALPDEDGQTLIPSVISFHPNGSVLVGKSARERRLVDPNNTIHSVKRLIGRSWDTDEVRRARTRVPFQMREGPGQSALVVARGESYTLPEISAFVLRQARTSPSRRSVKRSTAPLSPCLRTSTICSVLPRRWRVGSPGWMCCGF
jgi:molecular chaperone DnaK